MPTPFSCLGSVGKRFLFTSFWSEIFDELGFQLLCQPASQGGSEGPYAVWPTVEWKIGTHWPHFSASAS